MQIFRSLLLIVAAAFIGSGVAAQTATSPSASPSVAAPATSATAAPAVSSTAIPLAEVATQAESVSAMLRDIQAALSSDGLVTTVEAGLPKLTDEIETRSKDISEKVLAPDRSLETLRTLEVDWQRLEENLSLWTRDLTERAKKLDEQVVQLAQLRKIWDQTLKLAQNAAAPKEVVKRIKDLSSEKDPTGDIERVRKAAAERRAKILTLQTRVADQHTRVAGALNSVRQALKQARAEAVNRLFAEDSPPIWSVEVHLIAGQSVIQEGVASLAAQAAALKAYANLQSMKFLVHGLLFLMLLGTLIWARSRVQPWSEKEPGIEHAAQVFEMPIRTAIALSLLFGGWIYPEPPVLLRAIWVVAALIPTIMILRRLVEPHLFPILNALVIFSFVDQLRTIVALLPVLSRSLFLVEMLGGIAFLAWLIRASQSVPIPGAPGLAKTIKTGSEVALGGFTAAFLLNALGYVSLANLLGNAALGSACLAVILYAAARIGDGLIAGALSSRLLTQFGMVRHHRALIWRRMSRILRVGAVFFWAYRSLNMLSVGVALTDRIGETITAERTLGSLHLSLWNVLGFGISVWAAFLLSRFLRFALEEDVYPRIQLSRGLPYAISTMLHYVILLVGFFVATAALGTDMTKFTILAGAFGVGLGFGLQNIINNFVSGLILLFERPVNVGDVIQLDTASGVVSRIGIRASIVRTSNGSEIIVPNGKLISDSVINWTLSNRQRGIEIPIRVACGVDPSRVLQSLKEVAAAHSLVTDNPPPKSLFVKFAPDGLDFELHVWTDHYDQWVQIRSDLVVASNAAIVALG